VSTFTAKRLETDWHAKTLKEEEQHAERMPKTDLNAMTQKVEKNSAITITEECPAQTTIDILLQHQLQLLLSHPLHSGIQVSKFTAKRLETAWHAETLKEEQPHAERMPNTDLNAMTQKVEKNSAITITEKCPAQTTIDILIEKKLLLRK